MITKLERQTFPPTRAARILLMFLIFTSSFNPPWMKFQKCYQNFYSPDFWWEMQTIFVKFAPSSSSSLVDISTPHRCGIFNDCLKPSLATDTILYFRLVASAYFVRVQSQIKYRTLNLNKQLNNTQLPSWNSQHNIHILISQTER